MAISERCLHGANRAREIVKKYKKEERHLLSILHEVQAESNSLCEEDLVDIAEEMNIPVSKVYGVATFYSLYSLKPRGRYIIRICESAPCHISGVQAVISALERELGIVVGETTADGLFTLEFTSCLGLCGVAPAVMVNDQVFGNLTPEKAVEIVARFRAEGGMAE